MFPRDMALQMGEQFKLLKSIRTVSDHAQSMQSKAAYAVIVGFAGWKLLNQTEKDNNITLGYRMRNGTEDRLLVYSRARKTALRAAQKLNIQVERITQMMADAEGHRLAIHKISELADLGKIKEAAEAFRQEARPPVHVDPKCSFHHVQRRVAGHHQSRFECPAGEIVRTWIDPATKAFCV